MDVLNWIGDALFAQGGGVLKAATEGLVAGLVAEQMKSSGGVSVNNLTRGSVGYYIPSVVSGSIQKATALDWESTYSTGVTAGESAFVSSFVSAYLLDAFWAVGIGIPPSQQSGSYTSFIGSALAASLIAPVACGAVFGDSISQSPGMKGLVQKGALAGRTVGNALWAAFPEVADEIF